jgi:NAD-dependent DNA ligase
MPKCVKNPRSHRTIQVDGSTYKKLKKEGVRFGKSFEGSCSKTPREIPKRLPKPRSGHNNVVVSGTRAFKDTLENLGWNVQSRVTKDTDLLIVTGKSKTKETNKIMSAEKYGITIKYID